MNDPIRAENIQDELSFSDLDRFGKFLDLKQFDASNTLAQISTCRAWLVFQDAAARRWMRDSRTLWPPMHEQLDQLRKDLQQQNNRIDALCAGPILPRCRQDEVRGRDLGAICAILRRCH